MTLLWRVYYSSGEYFDHGEGWFHNLPARDVQAIVQKHPDVGWEIVSHSDYYVWWGDRWRGVDIAGYHDYLFLTGWKYVLFGRTLTMSEFAEIFTHASQEAEFGRKNGYLPREVKLNG